MVQTYERPRLYWQLKTFFFTVGQNQGAFTLCKYFKRFSIHVLCAGPLCPPPPPPTHHSWIAYSIEHNTRLQSRTSTPVFIKNIILWSGSMFLRDFSFLYCRLGLLPCIWTEKNNLLRWFLYKQRSCTEIYLYQPNVSKIALEEFKTVVWGQNKIFIDKRKILLKKESIII